MNGTTRIKSPVMDNLSGLAVKEQRVDGPRISSGNISYIADRYAGLKHLDNEFGVHGHRVDRASDVNLCAATHSVRRAFRAVEAMIAHPRHTEAALAALRASWEAVERI